MSKFNKNGIITGDFDSFCLLCEVHLKTEDELNNHLSELIHKKNMDSSKYLEKFKGHKIRKVKTGYYCEYCNLLHSTIAKTNIHVAEPKHVENKKKLTLRRYGSSLIADNDIVIAAPAWNGFFEDMCAVCNVEITDENAHEKENTHILNLIKRPVEFGSEGFMYRTVDETSYHCLTCNQIFTLNTLSSHHDDEEHKEAYKNCFKYNLPSFDNDADQESKADGKDLIISEDTETEKDKLFNLLPEFQKKGININFETEIAFCTKCSSNVDMSFKSIKSHIENHQMKNPTSSDGNKSNIVLSGKEVVDINHNVTDVDSKDQANELVHSIVIKDKELTENEPQLMQEEKVTNEKNESTTIDPKIFAKANNLTLTYEQGKNTSYCRICSKRLPSASIKSMKEHVAGASHSKKKQNVKLESNAEYVRKTKQEYVPKKSMEKFVESICSVESVFFHGLVVNEKYFLSILSFVMVTELGSHLRCQACEVNLARIELSDHLDSPNHEIAMEETPVVTNLMGEFVREVRRGLYHCGFCNLIAGDWAAMKQHLMCESHKDARSRAKLNLLLHLPNIQELRLKEQMARFFAGAFLFNGFNF